jgi:hypothetical protein
MWNLRIGFLLPFQSKPPHHLEALAALASTDQPPQHKVGKDPIQLDEDEEEKACRPNPSN